VVPTTVLDAVVKRSFCKIYFKELKEGLLVTLGYKLDFPNLQHT